jgi:transposase
VRFARADCAPCPHRAQCTRATREPRVLTLRPQPQYAALQAARRGQSTDAFRAAYAARAGIASTHAQGVRRAGLRRCRYRGLAKTRLQHVLTAAALNVVRIAAWHAGARPAATGRSAFARLRSAA